MPQTPRLGGRDHRLIRIQDGCGGHPERSDELTNISLKMLKSGTKKPEKVSVLLHETNKEGVEKEGSKAFCELAPPSKESCTVSGPVVLEAEGTWALTLVTSDSGAAPFIWEPYELSIGYTTSTLP
jgi:hypothetical protein